MLFNKKYKILLVHNFYQKPGGEDTVFINEKKLLEDNGHTVITYTRDNSEIKNSLLKKILLPVITIFNLKTYFDIKKIIKENNIDIVHVHNTLCLISPAVFYAAVKMKVPVVQTLHNFRMQCANGLLYQNGHICEDCINKGIVCALKHKCYRNSILQSLAIIIMLKIHRTTHIYKRVNFVCLTEFNKNKLLLINENKRIIDENKVFIKPNFVFENEFVKDYKIDDYSITQEVIQKYKNSYLFVGRLDEIKGVEIVLEAFLKMQSRVLLLIGSGAENYINQYSKFSNIKFIGQLSHNSVINIMENSKALIFPSKLYEGLPMTIVESYKSKLPVITCDIGNAKELVKCGVTGLYFEAGNVDSLINSIYEFENLELNDLKRNAYAEYQNKYNDKMAYELLINIYNKLLLN